MNPNLAIPNRSTVKPQKTQYRVKERAPEHMRAIVGRGVAFDRDKFRAAVGTGSADGMRQSGLGAIIDLINNSKDNPVYNMDVIEQVRWGMNGPQTPASINANFGSEIDLFGSGKSVAGIDYVETTMAQTGQTQTYFIACYLGFHVETDPMQWDTIGNGWTIPELPPAAVPGSPDVYATGYNAAVGGVPSPANGSDLTDLGFAVEGLFAGQALVPAVLQHGWWANDAAWHLVRGYNLRWKIGQHTNIMDEVLRHTAYMPPNAQMGSASDSEVDIIDFVNQMNARYASLGSGLIFLPVDALRVGVASTAGAAPFHGLFTLTRDFDRVGATFGGMDLRSMLHGNSEFRKLTLPYVIKPGVPIGLILQENDVDQGNAMRRFMDITQGQGGAIPPEETPYSLIGSSVSAGPITERTVDALTISSGTPLTRTIFKDGYMKLSLMIKGFEVTEDWYNIMSQNADIRDVVMNACGIRFAMQGGGS
jgi:hypothetical protein